MIIGIVLSGSDISFFNLRADLRRPWSCRAPHPHLRSTTPSDLPNTALKTPGLDRCAVAVLKPTVQIKRSVLQEISVRFLRVCFAEAAMDFRPAPHPIGGFLGAIRDHLVGFRWNRPAVWKLNQFSHRVVIGRRGFSLEDMLIKANMIFPDP
jgi:hypothetical protein